MAESVQVHLEGRLAEVQDLLRKKIFTKTEVEQIMRERSRWEYKLERRISEKDDFLGYIRYEKGLEEMRRERIAKFGIRSKHSISDRSICQHIFGLYRRALTKFKGDLKLWAEYLQTLKDLGAGGKLVGKAYASALQLHPHAAHLWIEAAWWEFQGQGRIGAARALLQRALRLLPKDPRLWLACFRLELEWGAMMHERHCILGIQADASDAKAWSPALPLLVHRHALRAVGSATLHQEMLQLVQKGDFHIFEGLAAGMQANASEALVEIPELAEQINLQDSTEAIGKTLQTLNSLVAERTKEGLCKSIALLRSLLYNESSERMMEEEEREALLDKLDQVYQCAWEEKDCLDVGMFLDWLQLMPQEIPEKESLFKEGLERFPESSELRLAYLENLMHGNSLWFSRSCQLIGSSPSSCRHVLLSKLIDMTISASVTIDEIKFIVRDFGSWMDEEQAKRLIDYTHATFGIDSVRQTFRTGLGKCLRCAYAAFELSQPNPIDSSIFEELVSIYPDYLPAWILRMQYERKASKGPSSSKTLQRLGLLYSMAERRIGDKVSLQKAYHQIIQ